MYWFVSLLCWFGYVNFTFSLPSDNVCPDVEPVKNFNETAFLGSWHVIARYPNNYEVSDCGTYDIGRIGDKLKLTYLTTTALPKDSPQFLETTFEVPPGDKGILKHEVTFGYPQVKFNLEENILAIDYDKYFISYGCQYEEESTYEEYAWISTRSKEVDMNTKATIESFIKPSKILDGGKFYWLDQQKPCP